MYTGSDFLFARARSNPLRIISVHDPDTFCTQDSDAPSFSSTHHSDLAVPYTLWRGPVCICPVHCTRPACFIVHGFTVVRRPQGAHGAQN